MVSRWGGGSDIVLKERHLFPLSAKNGERTQTCRHRYFSGWVNEPDSFQLLCEVGSKSVGGVISKHGAKDSLGEI